MKKAQILVVTLLILSIIAVVIVGIVNVLNLDTYQIENTQLYEESYSSAEAHLTELLALTSDIISTNDLKIKLEGSELIEKKSICNEESSEIVGNSRYKCKKTFISQELDLGRDISTEVVIEDQKSIVNHSLDIDDSLTINVKNYSGDIEFIWDKDDVAIEIHYTLYNQTTGEFYDLYDLYDKNVVKVYDSLNILPPNTILNISDFNEVASSSQEVSFSLNLGLLLQVLKALNLKYGEGITNATFENIIIVPRSTKETNITIGVYPKSVSDFPTQVRTYESIGFIDNNNPQSKIVSKVFLYDQIDSIFNYGFLTKGNI